MHISESHGAKGSASKKSGTFESARRLLVAPARRLFGTITNIETGDKVVALTFDDGPNPEYLPQLLTVLKKHNASATFFMVGKRAQQYPELVAEVARAGHAVGSHTWGHRSLPELSWKMRLAELRNGHNAIAPYGSPLFRPPYGHQSLMSRLEAWLLGFKVIGWNVDVWDWLAKGQAQMADELERKTRPGDIILLHDSVESEPRDGLAIDRFAMIAALDNYLERVRTRFEFLTVPELLQRGSPVRVNWIRKRRAKSME